MQSDSNKWALELAQASDYCSNVQYAGARLCCLDLDTFFVSVERLLDPTLVGKPVVVGGRRGSRGVVTAASYEVREYGIHSGMSLRDASRLAPAEAIFLPTRGSTYGSYSKRVREVLDRFTPIVQAASIDEFYLDFSGCVRLYRRASDSDGDKTIERIVREMCAAIRSEIGLPASAGIGGTRIISKIASGRAKPEGVLLVPRGAELVFLEPLPVRKFPGIGPKAEERLLALGVRTLCELVHYPASREQHPRLVAAVEREMYGEGSTALSRERPAFTEYDPAGLSTGSISNERTFYAGLGDDLKVLEQLLRLTERVCWRARKRRVMARTITLKLRYTDFQTISRSLTGVATDQEPLMLRRIRQLYERARDRGRSVRLVGVALSNLLPSDGQLPLPFTSGERVALAMDSVRHKFGYYAIKLGAPKA